MVGSGELRRKVTAGRRRSQSKHAAPTRRCESCLAFSLSQPQCSRPWKVSRNMSWQTRFAFFCQTQTGNFILRVIICGAT